MTSQRNIIEKIDTRLKELFTMRDEAQKSVNMLQGAIFELTQLRDNILVNNASPKEKKIDETDRINTK